MKRYSQWLSGFLLVITSVVLSLALVLPVSAQGAVLPESLLDRDWTLVTLQSETGKTADLLGKGLTIHFSVDGAVYGSSGCNTFRGSYTVAAEGTLSFSPLATTRMACEDAVNALENNYLTALGKVATYTFDGSQLQLLSQDGQTVLSYAQSAIQPLPIAVLPPEVLDKDWNLAAFQPSAGETTDLLSKSLTIHFSVDGAVSGSSGCNTFRGSYTLGDDGALSFSTLATTKMACEEAVNALESSYLAALGKVAKYTFDGSQLKLLSQDEQTVLGYALLQIQPLPASVLPSEVLDKDWSLVSLTDSSGGVTDTSDKGLTIRFTIDGQVSGSGGCNSFGGNYTVSANNVLTFGPLISTLMACEDTVNQLETSYFQALQDVASYQVSDSQLKLTTKGGQVLTYTLAPTPLCFNETGECITSRFLEYWQQNGGLSVFGYPISGQVDVQGVTAQYFERQRFELHPSNAAPYDVQLGRLGAELLQAQGTNWTTLPKADGAKSGCRYFAETQHNVCDTSGGPAFLSYWMSHGVSFDGRSGISYQESLALFGLPLSEVMEITNPDGDTVLAQWFERARFEYHPNNPADSRVQLGRLGVEIQNATVSTPTPAEVTVTEEQNGQTVVVPVGQTLSVRLNGNPTTGYSWRVTEIDSAVLQTLDGPEFIRPADAPPGAGGIQAFRFQALTAGTTTLTLVYDRSFEPDTPPTSTFSIQVEVQ